MLLRPGYEKAVSAVIDHLEGQPYLNAARIGVCGISRGTIAVRTGAYDSRVRAAVDVVGFYPIHYWDKLGQLSKRPSPIYSMPSQKRNPEEKLQLLTCVMR